MPLAYPRNSTAFLLGLCLGIGLLLGNNAPVRAEGASTAPAWTAREGFREAPIPPPAASKPGFTLTDPQVTGLRFTNSIPESRHLTNQILLNGSGMAAGDVDGDGRTDVFFAGFDNDSALFRNLGDWRFEDITAKSGVGLPGFDCTGAAMADLDGDSDLDLVVNTLAQGTLVLFNDGHGKFQAALKPLHPGHGAMTAAMADVDGDGFLDLYVVNYRTQALMDMPNTRMTFKKAGDIATIETVNGRPATDPEFADRFRVNALGGIEENGEPDVLFRNVGGTNFVEVPWTGGSFLDESGKPLTMPPRDWGLAAMFRDVNHDGRPDLYVCNDFQSPDRLWINQGGGRFQMAPALALRRFSLSSMAVDFADINADGHDDFLVLEMMSRDHRQRLRWVRENFPHQPVVGRYDDRPQVEQNTLQLGRGDGTWSEIAQLSGLEATEWAWGCAFLDVDLDGWEDVLVVNGMERAGRDLDAAEQIRANRQGRRLTEMEVFQARRIFPRLATPNLAFRNQRDLTFQDASVEWGFHLAAVSQSIALADLDNDGDQDVIVGNLNQAASIYRNDGSAPRIGVRLRGRGANTRAIGARIEVLGGPVAQSQEMIAGGRYLAGDDPIRSFAAPRPEPLGLRIRWPGGITSEIQGVRPNTLVEVQEPAQASPGPPPTPAPAIPAPFQFDDSTSALGHRHHEEAFDDFAQQPLLPHKLSQPGPGLAWADLDGDGDDDLVVGSGSGGTLSVFRNEGAGRFQPWKSPALQQSLTRDVTGLISLPQTNRVVLLAGLANTEDGAALGPAVLAWDPTGISTTEAVPATDSSPGPLAVADIDGDGDLDLFVGGRTVPSRWPSPATSRFFRYHQGRFTPDAERNRALASIGMVQGAVFTDVDGDGDADLALALEFDSIALLRQDKSGFVNITTEAGLAPMKGLWTSIAAGDFDNDGRMDLVAGNWGRNTPYERHRRASSAANPSGSIAWRIYHGDFNGDGIHDLLEAIPTSDGTFLPVQPLTVLAPALPFLRGRFPSHQAFAQAGVDGVLEEALARTPHVDATWMETTLFLNRGGTFEARALPVEAQVAPVFGIAVADADGDGNEDLFLAQNFFAVRPHTPRYDGGLGLWLRGDGRGGFQAVAAATSGIHISGEQRGAAVADFDGDGRIDLAVGQNGAETRLFRNRSARPGVTFRLEGPSENPLGIGAHLRWSGGSGSSPVRELRLGGGYLSQDAVFRPIARPPDTRTLEIVWPGNRRQSYDIPPGATSVVLRSDGSLSLRR